MKANQLSKAVPGIIEKVKAEEAKLDAAVDVIAKHFRLPRWVIYEAIFAAFFNQENRP